MTTDHTPPAFRVRAIDLLERARDIHRETCILARGDVQPSAYRCGMCEVLNAPAVPAAVEPPADRAALRDRIAGLFRHPPGQERLGDATPGEIADAVLAVLPPPVSRAAVLHEGADAVAADRDSTMPGGGKGAYRRAMNRAEQLLRRLADEAQPAEAPSYPDPIECGHEAALGEAEAEAERQLAAVQRVRHVLEVEPVLNRSALEYRGLIQEALMGAEAQQDGAQS